MINNKAAFFVALEYVLKSRPEIRDGELRDCVIEAAKRLPRSTNAPGCASSRHLFAIEASAVWTLDAALRKLNVYTTDEEQAKFKPTDADLKPQGTADHHEKNPWQKCSPTCMPPSAVPVWIACPGMIPERKCYDE